MKHYPLMKDKELLEMRDFIESLKAYADPTLWQKLRGQNTQKKRCMLFMWVTMPRLDFGIELMEAWGFKYKTAAFTWVKPTIDGKSFNNGPGYYTASNTELVLIGSCGKPLRPDKKMISPIIFEPKTRHSAKPIIVQERIELMYPEAKKIELFSRQQRKGWDCLGLDSSGDNFIKGGEDA